MESLATNSNYTSIANPNITRRRPSGTTTWVVIVKWIASRAAWTSGGEFNALTSIIMATKSTLVVEKTKQAIKVDFGMKENEIVTMGM
jgi:hypothetical protein